MLEAKQMEIEKVAKIVEKLGEKYESSEELRWKDFRFGRYGLELEHVSISFRRYESDDPYEENTMYIDFLGRSDQQVIETFSDNELRPFMPNAFATMQKLWKAGKMKTTGFDALLDDALKDIDSLDL